MFDKRAFLSDDGEAFQNLIILAGFSTLKGDRARLNLVCAFFSKRFRLSECINFQRFNFRPSDILRFGALLFKIYFGMYRLPFTNLLPATRSSASKFLQ